MAAVTNNSNTIPLPYTGRTCVTKTSLPYLPATIKLDQSVKNESAILGFSSQMQSVFTVLYPESEPIESLKKSLTKMNNQVSCLNNLSQSVYFAEKHETRNKILAMLVVALTVAAIAGTVGGCIILGFSAPLFPVVLLGGFAALLGVGLTPLALFEAFYGIQFKKKSIEKLNAQESIKDYQKELKAFMDKHYEEIKADLAQRIKASKKSELTQNQGKNLEEAKEELERLYLFSQTQAKDTISLSEGSAA